MKTYTLTIAVPALDGTWDFRMRTWEGKNPLDAFKGMKGYLEENSPHSRELGSVLINGWEGRVEP